MHRRAHLDENPFACPDPNCTMQFRSLTRCREHFARRHSEQGRLRQKREEEKVSACLKSAGIDFAREHFVSFECWKGTFARADFVVLGNGGVVLIEVDEGQHQDYEQLCEVTRMSNIHSAFAVQGNTLPVVFIRYNPHRFSVDTVVQKVSSKDRQAQLVRTIQESEFGEHASLEIVYMYYDTIKEGETLALNIWKDAGYSKTVLECCKCPVI